MLYDVDDEREENISFEEFYSSRSHLRKKAIICGIIILFCIIIIIVCSVISIKHKKSDKVANEELNESVNENIQKENMVVSKLDKYEGSHIQIGKHDMSKITANFVPKQNPNAQQEITSIYYSDEKIAYLTFDDGPSKNITPQILDILKQENVPATFFVLGSRVELYPDTLKREYEEGHYIANHGYSHQYSQIYRSKDTVFEEYVKCENAIRNALNNQSYNTYLFRFPRRL